MTGDALLILQMAMSAYMEALAEKRATPSRLEHWHNCIEALQELRRESDEYIQARQEFREDWNANPSD